MLVLNVQLRRLAPELRMQNLLNFLRNGRYITLRLLELRPQHVDYYNIAHLPRNPVVEGGDLTRSH